MRCLVTAGPTWEPLDRVRRLTNFSSGTLGGELANLLAQHGHDVVLLLSETAVWRQPLAAVTVESFSTTESLARRLRARATSEPLALFQAAAVSDFAAGLIAMRQSDGRIEARSAGKVDSRMGPLWVELLPTPKILPQLRDWFPAARITGWKYEVEGTREEACDRGREQLAAARTDLCVVNGPAYGDGFGLLRPAAPGRHLADRKALLDALTQELDPTRTVQPE